MAKTTTTTTITNNQTTLPRKKTHHVLVDELDDRVLDVEARVLGEGLGNDHHGLGVGLDAQLRATLDGRLKLLEAA